MPQVPLLYELAENCALGETLTRLTRPRRKTGSRVHPRCWAESVRHADPSRRVPAMTRDNQEPVRQFLRARKAAGCDKWEARSRCVRAFSCVRRAVSWTSVVEAVCAELEFQDWR